MEQLRPTGRRSIIWCKEIADLSGVRQSLVISTGEIADPRKGRPANEKKIPAGRSVRSGGDAFAVALRRFRRSRFMAARFARLARSAGNQKTGPPSSPS